MPDKILSAIGKSVEKSEIVNWGCGVRASVRACKLAPDSSVGSRENECELSRQHPQADSSDAPGKTVNHAKARGGGWAR